MPSMKSSPAHARTHARTHIVSPPSVGVAIVQRYTYAKEAAAKAKLAELYLHEEKERLKRADGEARGREKADMTRLAKAIQKREVRHILRCDDDDDDDDTASRARDFLSHYCHLVLPTLEIQNVSRVTEGGGH